ncbi:GGDEF domain-containing protein [Pseudoteredinibacter isoporae]|uniref:GGDEF domain-containing protein n=1 Tax=Pseudoteredinibacter isoporae TaxID=570281 RepID=UPI0031081FB8
MSDSKSQSVPLKSKTPKGPSNLEFQIDLWALLSPPDELPESQQKVIILVSIAAFLVIIPSTIYHHSRGQTLLTVLDAAFLLVIGGLLYQYFRKKNLLLPPAIFTLMISTISLSNIYIQGVPSSYWLFPLILGHAIVVNRSISIPYNLFMITTSGLLLYSSTKIFSVAFEFVGAALVLMGISYGMLTILLNLQHRLVMQSKSDSLTGLKNRRYMSEQIAKAMSDFSDNPKTVYGVVMLDVDLFKSINDEYGHSQGDDVLIGIASILSKTEELGNIEAMRIGGEEFLLLAKDFQLYALENLAETVRVDVEKLTLLPDNTVTISAGVAMLERDHDESEWLKLADICLYEAKRSGRNKVVSSHEIDETLLATALNENHHHRRKSRS